MSEIYAQRKVVSVMPQGEKEFSFEFPIWSSLKYVWGNAENA
jgi:hypothetical protein